MFLQRTGENQNIVQVHKNKMINHVPETVIDQGLEHGWSISQAERHYLVLVVPRRGVEGRLPLVPLPDADQVVGISQV